MKSTFKNKDILVTGGAGSIGRVIVRKLCKFQPKRIRVLDNNESSLFYLKEELNGSKPVRMLLGDVRNILNKLNSQVSLPRDVLITPGCKQLAVIFVPFNLFASSRVKR